MAPEALKILAIDDNPDNLITLNAVVRDVLPEAAVLTALSGPQGIALARAEDPDVILLDIVMPGMDGYAVCRALKADDRLRHIPVVFLTALRADRESRIQALEAGAEAFLAKPLDEVELIVQIRAMAKIKAANQMQRLEREQLAALVAERTAALVEELVERRRAEAERAASLTALRASEERYRILSELTSDFAGAYRANPDGTLVIEWLFGALPRLTGFTMEELTARGGMFGIMHPDDLPVARQNQQRLREQGLPYSHEFRIATKTGELRWLRDSASARRNERGEVRLYEAVQDITERKQVEELAHQQSEQLRLLYEASQRLNRTLNPEDIYQATCDFMSIIAPNDGLVISAFDPEAQLITCRAFWMKNHWLDVSPFPPIPLEEEGRGTQSIVIRTGQPMLINDYQARVKTAQTSYYVNDETNEMTPLKEGGENSRFS